MIWQHFTRMASLTTKSCFEILVLFTVITDAYIGLKAVVKDDGTYTVKFGPFTWLESAPPFFIIDGKKYSTADNSLKLIGVTNSNGTNGFGTWTSRDIHYLADKISVIASARNNNGVVTFNVRYIEGANSTRAPNVDQIICGFPGFKLEGSRNDLGFLAFGGHFTGDTDKSIGLWNKAAKIPGGLAGSGLLAVFDQKSNTVLINPLDNFMSLSMWKDEDNGYVYWGIMGGIDEVPAQFQYQTMINYNSGINLAIHYWGVLMQKYLNNTKVAEQTPDNDMTTRYLGYWTGDGDYYNKGPIPGKNYEDTIVAIQNEAINVIKMPYSYFQLDEWWCIKTGNKVKYWIADPTALPDGMKHLENVTQSKFLMYSGVWSSDNVYAKQNKGKYNFIIEGNTAIPDDPQFWDDLFSNAASWGLTTYDQDGLDETFMNLNATKSDLNLASRWLNDMGSAAARYNISILYSDGYPRHLYQSMLNPAVTQTRASSDYGKNKENWKIGISSIFADALNLAPNKDSFRTNKDSGGFQEPNPVLQMVVSILSRGPVGIGDGLSFTNASIVQKCCTQNGRILHAQHPATAIDQQIIQAAFKDGTGPEGELWSTHTVVSSVGFKNALYGVIFAADLKQPFVISPQNVQLNTPMIGTFPKSKIYKWNTPHILHDFNLDSTFTVDSNNCSGENFCLYFTAPVIEFDGQEVVILGETDKWIHMPHQRAQKITLESKKLTMEIDGDPGEKMEIWMAINGKIAAIATRADDTGYAHFVFERSPESGAKTSTAALFSILFCLLCSL